MQSNPFILAVLLGAVSINNEANGQVCFSSSNYPIGNCNWSIAYSDFNSDGKIDLAVGDCVFEAVYLLPGDGFGSFGPPSPITPDSLGVDTRGLISGDFNKDGKSDLALIKYGTIGYVKIFFGDGNGSFPVTNSFTVGDHPEDLCSADLNGDGNIDIITANNGSNDISVLLGDGTGNFTPHTEFLVGFAPVAITIGDFDGDSKSDLAVIKNNGSGPDSLGILLGDGTGALGSVIKYLTDAGSYSVCSKDFNADGFDDIAVANSNSNNVSVLLSKGTSGLFFPAFNYTAGNGSGLSGPFSVISEDFNSDGKPDLAVANFYQSIVCIIFNIGSGSFGPTTFYPAPSGPWTVISADFNSDGKPDLATANHDKPEVTVLLNCTTTGIEDSYEENYCSVFPNPTNSSFTISAPARVSQVRIFNPVGQEIENKFIDRQTELVFKMENRGIYLLQIITDKELITKKLIVE